MNDKRPQPAYVRPASLNEVERKRNVDRLNFENKLMVERLKRVPPVISKTALEEDFDRHLKAEANLRRRQMKPMGLPKDLMPHSAADHTSSSLFDSSTYRSQQSNFQPMADGSTSPIKNMSDFRKHVISSKKNPHGSGESNVFFDNSSISSATKKNSVFELDHLPK